MLLELEGIEIIAEGFEVEFALSINDTNHCGVKALFISSLAFAPIVLVVTYVGMERSKCRAMFGKSTSSSPSGQ